jgi:hypothetical protein
VSKKKNCRETRRDENNASQRRRWKHVYLNDGTAMQLEPVALWMGSVAEWSKALDLSIHIYLTPSGENPREFEPRRYQGFFLLRKN